MQVAQFACQESEVENFRPLSTFQEKESSLAMDMPLDPGHGGRAIMDEARELHGV
jgi:hypothetical protein